MKGLGAAVNWHRHVWPAVVVSLAVSACSGEDEPAVTTAPSPPTTTIAAAEQTDPPETTTAPFTRLVQLVAGPPVCQDVTFVTADEVELYGRFWPGGDTALLFGHDFSVTTPGSAGQRPPQSSESILLYAATMAREGYTVLAPDFRGHGASGGEFRPQSGADDLAAA